MPVKPSYTALSDGKIDIHTCCDLATISLMLPHQWLDKKLFTLQTGDPNSHPYSTFEFVSTRALTHDIIMLCFDGHFLTHQSQDYYTMATMLVVNDCPPNYTHLSVSTSYVFRHRNVTKHGGWVFKSSYNMEIPSCKFYMGRRDISDFQ
jgi:hypothetical protein